MPRLRPRGKVGTPGGRHDDTDGRTEQVARMLEPLNPKPVTRNSRAKTQNPKPKTVASRVLGHHSPHSQLFFQRQFPLLKPFQSELRKNQNKPAKNACYCAHFSTTCACHFMPATEQGEHSRTRINLRIQSLPLQVKIQQKILPKATAE